MEETVEQIFEILIRVCTEIEKLLQILTKSNSEDFCSLMQQFKKPINVYKEEYGNEFHKMTGVDIDNRLSIKIEKKNRSRINCFF